ncbi:hypothetical protein ACQ86I_09425 [Prescottella equi]
MSRRFGRTAARRLAVRVTATVAAAAAGAVVFSGVANAAPAPAAPPSLQTLLGDLTKNVPLPQDLLGGLLATPGVTEVIEGVTGQEVGTTTAKDFLFPAPTFGCGVADNPMTVTVASAQSGPNFPCPRGSNAASCVSRHCRRISGSRRSRICRSRGSTRRP